VLPWNLRQFISYFFTLIIYSINLLKTTRKTFATGNAIYPLPRTIIQITKLPNFKKKTEHVQFLRKCNEKISGIKNELTLRQRRRDVSFKKPVR
jgi:hypothetical protein